MTKQQFIDKLAAHLAGLKNKIEKAVASLDEAGRDLRQRQLPSARSEMFYSEKENECAEHLAAVVAEDYEPDDWHRDWVMCAHVISNFQPEKAADWKYGAYFRLYMDFYKRKTENILLASAQ